jgi:drug/metabolite transporter (DMT)-like permease
MESSIINNTMLFQIAILAWVFLGETLSLGQVFGIIMAIIGTILIQIRSIRSI